MKKVLVFTLIGAIIVLGGTIGAFAARDYIDENKDGICDNYKKGNNVIDENNNGICDNKENGIYLQYGNGNRQQKRQYVGSCGKNYVDENSDGICDNKGLNCLK